MKNLTFEINAGFISGQNKYKRMTEKNKTKDKAYDYVESQALYKDSYESNESYESDEYSESDEYDESGYY